eukprot:TRINITY_DN57450_c0_g1_i1.p1 TRINITY_DN57450_c0_g1~~TRINITY_DN57450_c0_g1_i1.p1  ORF type:complete len:282 (+),score=22.89 TRINITY_DN57450_c0_g1_i1:79-924(+)
MAPWFSGDGNDVGLCQLSSFFSHTLGSLIASAPKITELYAASPSVNPVPQQRARAGHYVPSCAVGENAPATTVVSTSFGALQKYDVVRDWQDAGFRQKFRESSFDKGMKFEVVHKTPLITSTDLFDVHKFGCRTGRTPPSNNPLGSVARKLAGCLFLGTCDSAGSVHPEIHFGVDARTIGVKLQDLTSGEVRWDAIYRLHNKRALLKDDSPIGGNHPLFKPDWCPAPGDFSTHTYRFTVSNLDSAFSPGMDKYGEMIVTQYGPSQLANSYQWESQTMPTEQ